MIRVRLEAGEPDRRAMLAASVEAAGHVVAQDDGPADVRLVDLPSSAAGPAANPLPLLVLTDQPGFSGDPAIAGVIRRAAAPAAIDAALRAVAAGLRVRAPGPAEPRGFAAVTDDPALGVLTPRELEILAAVGDGLSNKAVARRLGISAHTVKFHLEAVFVKLGVTSRAEAVAKGLRNGLIEL